MSGVVKTEGCDVPGEKFQVSGELGAGRTFGVVGHELSANESREHTKKLSPKIVH